MQTPTMHGGSATKWKAIGADLLVAKVTLMLVLILAIIQTALEAGGGFAGNPALYGQLGLSRNGLASGYIWEFFSYALIHGSWVHLMINVLCLLAIGPRIERIGGGRLLGCLLLGGCLAGGLFHLLLGGADGTIPLVGISGGVTAILLWLTGVSPGSRMWPIAVSGKNLGIGILLASVVLTLLNPNLGIPYFSSFGGMLGSYVDGSVSHACHLGGALLGWGAARWSLRPRVTLAKLQKQRARRESAGGSEQAVAKLDRDVS